MANVDTPAALSERQSLNEDVLDTAVEQVLRPAIEEGLFDEGGAEHYIHAQIVPEAQSHLTSDALSKDPVEAVQSALDAHVNLLAWRELDDAKTLIDDATPETVRDEMGRLLYGDAPVDERIRRGLAWGDAAAEGDLNGTVVSYLLAVHAPATHAFCKPSVYRAAATALLGAEAVRPASDEAERIVHATRLYSDVLRRLREDDDLPLTDLLHIHPLFYKLSGLTDTFPNWSAIREGAREEASALAAAEPAEPYAVDQATDDLFHGDEAFASWLRSLRTRKNVILQGPPGVGKTFVARKLAYALMEATDDSRLRMVQFHQSYAYEDFIRGFRPGPDGDFRLQDGVFYRFCRRAQQDSERPYVFLIDEINRGNLSKIFGELMMLIEPDKRGPEHKIPLTYQSGRDEDFYVPENVHLIGMMNTADRSLAMVDYALRRRFRFIDMEPQFGPRFREHLRTHGASESLIDHIVERLRALNETIREDSTLGPGFRVGHSYFCPRDGASATAEWYKRIVEHEIAPLLHEYWFDAHETAHEEINALMRDL